MICRQLGFIATGARFLYPDHSGRGPVWVRDLGDCKGFEPRLVDCARCVYRGSSLAPVHLQLNMTDCGGSNRIGVSCNNAESPDGEWQTGAGTSCFMCVTSVPYTEGGGGGGGGGGEQSPPRNFDIKL